jgi:hypothetical protein
VREGVVRDLGAGEDVEEGYEGQFEYALQTLMALLQKAHPSREKRSHTPKRDARVRVSPRGGRVSSGDGCPGPGCLVEHAKVAYGPCPASIDAVR